MDHNFRLDTKQNQKTIMTIEMRKSIEILQLNTYELRDYINNLALENPLIEVDAPSYSDRISPSEMAFDPYSNIADSSESFRENIIKQIKINYRDTKIRQLMIWLVDYLDEFGYLTITLEEAQKLTNEEYITLLDALTLIQTLDPPGLGARSEQERLLLITEHDNNCPPQAYLLLEESYELICNREFNELKKLYCLSDDEMNQIYSYIKKIKSISLVTGTQSQSVYIYPELFLKVSNNNLLISLNRTDFFNITLDHTLYSDLLKASPDSNTTSYIKECRSRYEWLQKALTKRKETILRVGTLIANRQKAFFLGTKKQLVPLTMKDIAAELDLSVSTVSRTVNGKYMDTPIGTIELRALLSNKIQTGSKVNDEDGSSSNEAKIMIADLIINEDKTKPLSDQKITDYLNSNGIKVSRRTVMKYREALQFPSSTNRKQR